MLLYPPLGYDEHGVRWVRFGYIGAWGRALQLGRVLINSKGGGYTNIHFRDIT